MRTFWLSILMVMLSGMAAAQSFPTFIAEGKTWECERNDGKAYSYWDLFIGNCPPVLSCIRVRAEIKTLRFQQGRRHTCKCNSKDE